MEGASEKHAERGRDDRVTKDRSRAGVERSADDLGDVDIRHLPQIRVGGRPAEGLRNHGRSLRPPPAPVTGDRVFSEQAPAVDHQHRAVDVAAGVAGEKQRAAAERLDLLRHGLRFALCGSSARRVKRGHANLLGGRALRYELLGLVSAEIGRGFDVTRAASHGFRPRHYRSDRPGALLRSYVNDYLKDEIAAEGLVRNLPSFSGFLSAAALSDGELVNFTNIARDCGISGPTVREHFQILVDTLLGSFLPAYTKRPKRLVIQAPKFYFADVGEIGRASCRERV